MLLRPFRRMFLSCSLLALLAAPGFSDDPPVASVIPQDCAGVPPGGRCKVTQDHNPNDCKEPQCIEGRCETTYPAPGGKPCTDTDGNPCTVALCLPGSAICGQTAPAPLGTPCPDTDGSPCSKASCQNGICNQGVPFPPVPAMNDLSAVVVEARPARVDQSEAFTDCCWFCQEQSIEALRPTLNGPERIEPDGFRPFRTKYCGTVVRYGINDELADPRDIMLNIVPSPGFEHFVKGFLNTECGGLTDDEEDQFAKDDQDCLLGACLIASENKAGKCIHAEVTPANQFYGKDFRFLPISDTLPSKCNGKVTVSHGQQLGGVWECKSALEPASEWSGAPPPGGVAGQEGREVCVYGVYSVDHGPDHRMSSHQKLCCSKDASHDRPEIHPFDAVWFRHPDGQPGWIFGVFQDDSNRYSFTHCGDNNGNTWSQAPRDLTFRFPFRFPRSSTPLKACLRHTRTTNLQGSQRQVAPVNVTTAVMPSPLAEVKALTDGPFTVFEVVEPGGAEGETQVRIEGCVTPTEVSGFLTVRVAVGCPRGASCPGLNDTSDKGSGYYYGEITFEPSCN
ncbi:MAG TPA: hypothetical protein VN851_25645 [Thermoanaerobaculia bacterium]|nr:hypothetical protein [Thermoanaerobaculia bacterium]